MDTPIPEKLNTVYFQNLDACRFLAAISVFILHFSNEIRGLFPELNDQPVFKLYYTVAGKGNLGVNFFFVLSGFLITYLILKEQQRHGSFHLGKFLVRRTLRIWPVYYFVALLGFVIFPLILTNYQTRFDPYYYLFFLANFEEIKNGATNSINFFTAPWSVAVEEQFYIIWGILLFMLFRLKSFKLPYLLLFLSIVSLVFRWINFDQERVIYYHTLSVMQDIVTGAFLGYSLHHGKKWVQELQQLPKGVKLIIYLSGFIICIAKNKLFIAEGVVFERIILSLFFGFLVLDQISETKALFQAGKFKSINYLGRISYGLYMYHLVVMFLLLYFIPFHQWEKAMAIPLFLFLSLSGTILVAVLSFHLIESKFLSLKPKH